MPARRSDSRQNVIRQLNSLLTKHVVAAGNSNKDAGSTPAASTIQQDCQLRWHFDLRPTQGATNWRGLTSVHNHRMYLAVTHALTVFARNTDLESMQRISPDKPKPKPTMWTPPVIFGFTALAYGCGYSYGGDSVVVGVVFAAAFLAAMIEARRRDKGA